MSHLSRLVLFISLGCGCGTSSNAADPPDAAPAGTPDAPASSSGLRTLDSCTTSIAADAPAFYKRYFRCVTITSSASGVTIATDDLPPHKSAYYPKTDPNYVAWDSSRGSQYHQNPNSIAKQAIAVKVPASPAAGGGAVLDAEVDGQAHTSGREYNLGPAGVALDGTAIYAGFAAPGDDLAAEAYTFDDYGAHPDPGGSYHYHSPTPGPLEVLQAIGAVTKTTPGTAEVELYGVLCDGTVVLGCTELDGKAPAGSLDAQGGHVGDLAADGTTYFTGRYHVHVCADAKQGHAFTPEIHYYAACN